MPAQKLATFLKENRSKYITLSHSPAYTAAEVAESAHIKGGHLAKTVILNADDQLIMAVIPASHQLDIETLRPVIGATELSLSSEKEFRDRFPTCELGALPPFGQLYGMEIYIADCLSEDKLITFCAGTSTELIQMEYEDYQRLVQPRMISVGFEHFGETPPRMREHRGIHRI